MSISQTEASTRRKALRALHESGCFVVPNPWDVGSARYLEGLGFKALASTSAGVAWSRGHADGGMGLEDTLAHAAQLLEATTLPLNADFESGFASDASGVARNVRRAIEVGVSALSLEDSTGFSSNPLRSIESGVERIRAARGAIDEVGGETLLIGRAENFFVGVPDLDDAIRRLQAYSEAGADMLYAPGLTNREQIRAVVTALAPKPVNVLVGDALGITMSELRALGVRRVSVGGALARAAWGGFMRAARQIAEDGTFDALKDGAPGSELNAFFTLGERNSDTDMKGEVVGPVEYRNGEGPLLTVREGLVDITLAPGDATLSWTETGWRGEASIPFANFCRYVTRGSIVLREGRSRITTRTDSSCAE